MPTLKQLVAVGLLYSILSFSLVAIDLDVNNLGRFSFTADQERVEIPFYTFNNQVILSVLVNEKVPLNFILDSGTSQAIFFDRKLAQEIGIGFGRKVQFSGVGNSNHVLAFRTRGVKLELPGVIGDRMGMAVLMEDYMDMKRFDIHGVIGYQLFARFAVKIDYLERVLTLMEPHKYATSGFQSFDLQIENSKPYIESDVCFKDNLTVPLKLLIDTGAAFGLSLITGINPEVKAPGKSKKTRLATGLGGDIMGTMGMATLKLGSAISSEVVTYYIKFQDYSHKGVDPHKIGSIGGRLLRDFVVILDYTNSKVLLQPQSTAYLTEIKI